MYKQSDQLEGMGQAWYLARLREIVWMMLIGGQAVRGLSVVVCSALSIDRRQVLEFVQCRFLLFLKLQEYPW